MVSALLLPINRCLVLGLILNNSKNILITQRSFSSDSGSSTLSFKKKPQRKLHSFFSLLERKPTTSTTTSTTSTSTTSTSTEISSSDRVYDFYTKQFNQNTFKHLDFFIKNIIHFVRMLRGLLILNKTFSKTIVKGTVHDVHCFFKEHKQPPCTEIEVLALAVMRMLVQFVYHSEPISGKFTIGWIFRKGVTEADHGYIHVKPDEDTSTIGPAISLLNPEGEMKPSFSLFRAIVLQFLIQAEKYEDQLTAIECLRVKVFQEPNPATKDKPALTEDQVDQKLIALFKSKTFLSEDGELPMAASFAKGKQKEKFITQLKPNKGAKLRTFIVADLETIMFPEKVVLRPENTLYTSPIEAEQMTDEISSGDAREVEEDQDQISPDDVQGVQVKIKETKEEKVIMVHVPCAAGFAIIYPSEDVKDIPDERFERWYSEDYRETIPCFRDRSEEMMKRFLNRIADVAFNNKIKTVYFHNLSGFDGFMIQRSYLDIHELYKERLLTAMNRNGRMYKLTVKCIADTKKRHYFQDSVLILPGSLKKLGKAICPEIGDKGDIPRDWTVDDLQQEKVREQMIEYMVLDIRILGGFMCKTQTRFFEAYATDMTTVLTISALAMLIFRLKYLNSKEFKIYIPTRNEDKYIRRTFYGGHSDVYKPYGEDLFYFDVNSLYPYIMKTYNFPEGKPKWVGRFDPDTNLKDVFGFVTAYIFCPDSIKRPLLPYRDGPILKFPTGEWVDKYFTPELVKAIEVGYTVIPMHGYIYRERPSPFKKFVNELYESRLAAKAKGDEAMSFVYKMLLNSLFGRLGMNPRSEVTIHCTEEECRKMVLDFQNSDGSSIQLKHVGKIGKGPFFQAIYTINHEESEQWNPPKNTAVQMSSAITSYARIYMYDYLNRDSTYYSDTDSLVCSDPLPPEICSQTELGKFKLEHELDKAVFLAPKGYTLWPKGDGVVVPDPIVRQKGMAFQVVTAEWFLETYNKIRSPNKQAPAEPTADDFKKIPRAFVKDRKESRIYSKDFLVSLLPSISNKRLPVFDEAGDGAWIDTKPVKVYDLGKEEPNVLLIKARVKLDAERKKTEAVRKTLEQEKSLERNEIESLRAQVKELQNRLKAAGLDFVVDEAKADKGEDQR